MAEPFVMSLLLDYKQLQINLLSVSLSAPPALLPRASSPTLGGVVVGFPPLGLLLPIEIIPGLPLSRFFYAACLWPF